jgi:hypothetical protein
MKNPLGVAGLGIAIYTFIGACSWALALVV